MSQNPHSDTPKTVFILKQHQSTIVPKNAKITLQLLNYIIIIIINQNHLHTSFFSKFENNSKKNYKI